MLAILVPMLGPDLVPRNLDLKLVKELTADLSQNQAVSPFVMSTLMTQLWMGANGTTRDEVNALVPLLLCCGSQARRGSQIFPQQIFSSKLYDRRKYGFG